MNIEERKRKLAEQYGIEPTVSFYYYTWNVVDYAGEDRVRETFESIAGQGDEVIVGIYDPNDATQEIAEEYGLKVSIAEKEPHDLWDFPESKVRNKVIIDSSYNYVAALNINIAFEPDLGERVKNWLSEHSSLNEMLRIRYQFHGKHKDQKRQYGKTQVFYKPYLLAARGYDERTGFCTGSQRYGGLMMRRVFNLKKRNWNTKMVHKYHNEQKRDILRQIYPEGKYPKDLDTDKPMKSGYDRTWDRGLTKRLHRLLQEDFDANVSLVRNSYW